jgi:hypothetical protein
MVLTGCADSERTYDAGYSDGYAVGYNTACEIGSTMIYGHFDSKEYSRGYAIGEYNGKTACRNDSLEPVSG